MKNKQLITFNLKYGNLCIESTVEYYCIESSIMNHDKVPILLNACIKPCRIVDINRE